MFLLKITFSYFRCDRIAFWLKWIHISFLRLQHQHNPWNLKSHFWKKLIRAIDLDQKMRKKTWRNIYNTNICRQFHINFYHLAWDWVCVGWWERWRIKWTHTSSAKMRMLNDQDVNEWTSERQRELEIMLHASMPKKGHVFLILSYKFKWSTQWLGITLWNRDLITFWHQIHAFSTSVSFTHSFYSQSRNGEKQSGIEGEWVIVWAESSIYRC